MLRKIYDPDNGKMRVVGIASGSGNTLWSVKHLQDELEKTEGGSPFEVVGIFVDNPEAKAVKTAAELGIPVASIDIRKFYEQKQAPMKDMETRAEYDKEMAELIAKWDPDYVLLAGYVWAVTEVISGRFNVCGVHPGDLTVQENGVRLLAGTNGVKSAFKYHRNELRASSYLATPELDGGPILITSPAVPVDYSLHQDEEERFRYYLKLVNEQNRLAGARTICEIASGNFEKDDNGALYYKGEPAPFGIKLENWD